MIDGSQSRGSDRAGNNEMRRYFTVFLFFIVLVTPFILRQILGGRTTAAASDSPNQLIVLTSHAESIRREFGTAFSSWYKKTYGQNVYVDYMSLGSGEIGDLLKDRSKTLFPSLHTYQVDVVWGGGDFYFDNTFSPYLKEMQLDPALMAEAFPNPTLNGLPLYDQNPKHKIPHWYGAALSSFGITFNRPVLAQLKLREPKTWSDLADPKYDNWLGLGDPVASGSVKQAFLAIVEKAMADAAAKGQSEDLGWQRGMGEIRLICSNARTYSSVSSLIPELVASGDAAAGMTIDFYGRSEVEAVPDGRLGYVQPAGATIINPDPIALVDGVENDGPGREILAQRFIQFVLSRQGQLLWNQRKGTPGGPISSNLRRLPIMPSVFDDVSNFTDKENPFTASKGFNKRSDREKTYGIVGELIECSCIDCMPELRKTRQTILGSSHRSELTDRLGMFPFDQQEALRRLKIYKQATPVEQLALKRAWTDEFKIEYELLRVEAELK